MQEYRPGDIVEVETAKGLAYVQVTHSHPSYPSVVRFLGGPVKERPKNVTALAGEGRRTIAMVPLEGVLKKLKLASAKVGAVDIPYGGRKFPTFRMPVRGKQGEILYWWFWDGQGLTYATELDEVQKELPLREVMSSEKFLHQLTANAI